MSTVSALSYIQLNGLYNISDIISDKRNQLYDIKKNISLKTTLTLIKEAVLK